MDFLAPPCQFLGRGTKHVSPRRTGIFNKFRALLDQGKYVDRQLLLGKEPSHSLFEYGMAPVPASLKAIQPYIKKAEEMKNADPIVAYYCKDPYADECLII
jgi:hypothetical protein